MNSIELLVENNADEMSEADMAKIVVKELTQLTNKVSNLIVNNSDSLMLAAGHIKDFKLLKSQLDTIRKDRTEEERYYIDVVNTYFKQFFNILDPTSKNMRKLINDFAETLDTDFKDKNEHVNVFFKTIQSYEVVNKELVPRKFLIPNDKMIKAAIMADECPAGIKPVTKKQLNIK